MRFVFITILLTLFVCVGAQAEQKSVNAPEFTFDFPDVPQLKSFFENYENELRDEMSSEFAKAKAEGDIYNPWSLNANAEVAYKGKFWVVAISGYDYRGGAHGLPLLDAVYFDAETFEKISQSALLTEDAYEVLSGLSRKELVSQGFESDDEWMLGGTEPVAENFRMMVPSKEEVVVIFDSYQIAPYSTGTPQVKLSWSAAKDIFKETYRP